MKPTLQRDSDIPLYLQVKDILLQRILQGDYIPGSSLPAEPDLCAEFGVARGTVRQALSKLEIEGLVRREQGRGTFVTLGDRGKPESNLQNQQIGFVVPYVRDSFIATILLGVERAARDAGLSVMFKHAENSPARQAEVLRELTEHPLGGIILYPVNSMPDDPIAQLLQAGYPIVLVDRYLRGLDTDYVMSDHFGGALRATQHLLRLGHTRIGFVSWRDPAVSLEHRRTGYIQAHAEHGMAYDPGLTCEVEGYPSVAVEPLADFIHDTGVTAIFAANDQLALAVYKAARQLGRHIPQNLALVGFDNLDFTMHLDVPLTTVEQPAFDLGREAVGILVRRLYEGAGLPQQLILPTRLLVRRSCGMLQPERERANPSA